MSLEKILIGTLSGLAAGLAIGILTAPDKGVETRRKIRDTADDIKDRVNRFTRRGASELEELNDIFQNKVKGLSDDVRNRVLDLIAAAKTGANNVRKEVSAN